MFAHSLNVRKDPVSKWERGEKRPDGPSLKLLNLVKTQGLKWIARSLLSRPSPRVHISFEIGDPIEDLAQRRGFAEDHA
jgi:hypothetical protein